MTKKKEKKETLLPKAVVFSCLGDSQGALSVVTSLGRKGISVTVLSECKESLALTSKYCLEPICIDGFFNDVSGALDFLVDYSGRQERKPVLFPTSDPDLLFISELRGKLDKHYDIVISSREIIENFTDKRRFFYLAYEYNFPIPYTMFPENLDDVLKMSKNIEYPVIVKPALPLSWMNEKIQEIVSHKKAVILGSRDELVEMYKRLSLHASDVMIQEYIPGADNDIYFLQIYMNKRSEPIAYFTGKKVRTYPASGGVGCFLKSTYEKEIVNLGINILKKANYTGLALLQFKRDPVYEVIKLIEINPRISFWNLLACECGVNLPYTAYADTIGKPVTPPESQREDIKYFYPNGDWTLL